jgi:hypothetical protein
MKLSELSILIGQPLRVIRQPNPTLDKPWQASLDRTEVLYDEGLLTSAYGRGETTEEAIAHYCKLIAGERLVINSYTDRRQEINAPVDLTPN